MYIKLFKRKRENQSVIVCRKEVRKERERERERERGERERVRKTLQMFTWEYVWVNQQVSVRRCDQMAKLFTSTYVAI